MEARLALWSKPLSVSVDWQHLVAHFRARLEQALAALTPLQLQRRRTMLALVCGLGSWLLRPIPPLSWLPGWVVGGLLLWAAVELALLVWRPRRWR